MPLTLAQLSNTLGTYVEPSGDFKASLNQVLARMQNMGVYRDLTIQYSLPVVDGCITLPDEADSVLHTLIDGLPAPVRSLWHDFKSVGLNGGTGQAWGLIDAGFHPTLILLPETGVETLNIVPAASDALQTTFSEGDGSSIRVTATNGTSVFQGGIFGTAISFDSAVNNVISIQYDGLPQRYDLRIDANDPDTTVATVGPDSGVTRYRRFRINGSTDGQTTVHVLCKRAFVPLRNDNDITYVSNIGAIKQGLLGRLAEDNGDIERAEYHWQRCNLLLEEEVNSTRGAAVPRLCVDPYGTGNLNRLRPMF